METSLKSLNAGDPARMTYANRDHLQVSSSSVFYEEYTMLII